MIKALLPFIYQLIRRKISRIYGYLDVGYGFDLLSFKQKDAQLKVVKESHLAMFPITHEISYGMMLNHNDAKLQSIMSLMKDSMMSLPNLSIPTHSIYFVYLTDTISKILKVLLMNLLTWNLYITDY